MTQQKTSEITRDRENAIPDGDPFEQNDGDLREQAAAYASIAREAREDCETDVDPEKQLHRRRNVSGQ